MTMRPDTHPPIFLRVLREQRHYLADGSVTMPVYPSNGAMHQLARRLDNADVIDVAEGNLRQYDRHLQERAKQNRLSSYDTGVRVIDAMFNIDRNSPLL